MADSAEAGELDGEGRDSGASIMSRGGKHGDTSALGKMMSTVQRWVDEPLTDAQIQSEISSRWMLMAVSLDTSPKWHWLQRA